VKSQIGNQQSQIAIVGAGPAGSSLAIRLAARGFGVTLVERESFPRHKLCGEFISPECLRHFSELGADGILSAGGERISETRFYDRRGRDFTIPSSMLDGAGFALSLSRFEMDRQLINRARDVGVSVLEKTRPAAVEMDDGRITSLLLSGESGQPDRLEAGLFVDATGRAGVLSKLIERSGRQEARRSGRPSLAVGFKAHFENARVDPGTCEIYFFPGGYGGLTPIENGAANLCFIVDPRAARKLGSDPNGILRNAVMRNARAADTLEKARPAADWLAVSVNSFGRAEQAEADNLSAVGDAAAFIDPFTGSGMLMALESSALLAEAVVAHAHDASAIARVYSSSYDRVFSRRLRVCSYLRRAAFVPLVPTLAISFFNFSKRGRSFLASSTRSADRFAAGRDTMYNPSRDS